jgi:hypothetical protein
VAGKLCFISGTFCSRKGVNVIRRLNLHHVKNPGKFSTLSWYLTEKSACIRMSVKDFREQLWINLLHIFRQVTGWLQFLRRCCNIVYIHIYFGRVVTIGELSTCNTENKWNILKSSMYRSWRLIGGLWIYLHTFLTSALDGGECLTLRLLMSYIGRGLCDELITRPEEPYRLWWVVVCDLETSRICTPYICICDIRGLRVNDLSLLLLT